MVHGISDDTVRGGARRILGNVAWLIGGKGFGAVCSIVYLGILARSLGVENFGLFSMIFATGQAIVELSKFQTWQMVVRFGMPALSRDDWDGFGRLAVAAGFIDFLGALLGCLMGWVAVYYLGQALDLDQRYTNVAFGFICALAFARASAPIGVLRALDRFDVAVAVGAITPLSRLIAAIVIWSVGATVELFLIAWAVLELIVAALHWFFAQRLARRSVRLRHLKHFRRTMSEHEGIFRFLGVVYLSTSVWGLIQQGPLLAVGYLLGASAAGVYRIADQLAKGLGKLATLMAQALYPEMNRQAREAGAEAFGRLLRRINVNVIVAGAALVLLSMLLGDTILVLIGGEAYGIGGPVLVPLVLAASFELASVSYEAVLHAYGKEHYQLYARIFTLLAMTVLIVLLASGGPIWIGWAVAGAMALGYAASSVIVWLTVRHHRKARA